MARLLADPSRYFGGIVGPKSRVLLVNPPVHEKRYNWLRWNQPSELLKLSTWLKARSPGVDVKIFDFMLPDAGGNVAKHKVKHSWTGADDDAQLWHFGRSFDEFGRFLSGVIEQQVWVPDCVIVSSLTSYWHASVEELLVRVCAKLGAKRRPHATIALYGNYPRLEPEHASTQRDADVALTSTVNTQGCTPDFGLYLSELKRPPTFYALDVEDPGVGDHLEACVDIQAAWQKARGVARPPTVTVAFFNDDLCSSKSQLARVAQFALANPKKLVVEGIAGVNPRTLSRERLEQMKASGFRTLFVEHARLARGGLDEAAYSVLRQFLQDEATSSRSTGTSSSLLRTGAITGFVHIGLPDDDMDELVRTTLVLNQYFHAIILKPFGYSPDVTSLSATERRQRWHRPAESSPQWFPFSNRQSSLQREDYDNLVRWQGVLNRRVKGTTFDFLDEGDVAKLVRETLVAESWKPHSDTRQ